MRINESKLFVRIPKTNHLSSIPVIIRIIASSSLFSKSLLSHSLEVFSTIILKSCIILSNEVLVVAFVHSLLMCANLCISKLI